MISYKQWKTLHESIDSYTLGVVTPQSMGLVNRNIEEMDMNNPMMKKKFPHKPDMGDEEDSDDMDDDNIDPDDMGDDDNDSDMDDDSDMDSDDEMGDDDDMDSDDNEMMPKKKKSPMMGEPHNTSPFMNYSKRMKEDCGDMDDEKGDEKELDGKDDDDKELKFLQKKMKKKLKKGCSDGKVCNKCKMQKKNMKESAYARPKNQTNSDKEFINSLKSMFGNPGEKFSDGLKNVSEDLLLHPDLQPGEPGYPVPTHNGVTESIDALHKRIAELEKQLKRK